MYFYNWWNENAGIDKVMWMSHEEIAKIVWNAAINAAIDAVGSESEIAVSNIEKLLAE